MNESLWQIMWQADWVVKSVLLILSLGSLYSWALAFAKKREFSKVAAQDKEFLKKFNEEKNWKKLQSESENYPNSSIGHLFGNGHDELFKLLKQTGGNDQLYEHFSSYGLKSLERTFVKGQGQIQSNLNEGLSSLASLGSLAPFIGLFGTVWGIIHAFQGMGSGGAGLDSVAPGMAEALVATAIGLAAAIPAVFFYNYFQGELEKVSGRMEKFELDFLNSVEKMLIEGR